MNEPWVTQFLAGFQSDEARTYAGVALEAVLNRGAHVFAVNFWNAALLTERAYRAAQFQLNQMA